MTPKTYMTCVSIQSRVLSQFYKLGVAATPPAVGVKVGLLCGGSSVPVVGGCPTVLGGVAPLLRAAKS